MNLSQLRFASTVAASGSFTDAAAQCCVTQPTLSNGIAQLENQLGGRLFVRTTRKVALTPFGAQVIPYIDQVLDAQASLIRQAEAFLHPAKRLIRIGTSPLVSSRLLAGIIESFHSRDPAVEFVLHEMNMSDLHRMLDQGLLDFILGVAGTKNKAWISARLYDEPLLFIPKGATGSKKQCPSSVQLKDIANETYVMVPDTCGLARATRAIFRRQRRKLNEYSGEAMSYRVLEEWAALGIGAAMLPRSKVTMTNHPLMSIIDKAGDEISIRFEATWLRSARTPHLVEFAKHLQKSSTIVAHGL